MFKQIFVNLPVNDLEKTKKFWTGVGLTFNPQFTDQNAAALVIGENLFAMLLLPEFFKRFTKKEIIDTKKSVEVINALSVESRGEVDEILEKVIAGGGRETRSADDYGWMYARAFEDIDGHLWEVVYMDMTKVPKNPQS